MTLQRSGALAADDPATESNSHRGNHRKLPRHSAHVAVISFLVAVLSCFFTAGTAQAVTTFPGGECTLVFQTNGVRLDFCKNTTDQTVDDIHVTFSHPNLPNRLVDYGQSIPCTLFGTGNCFGPAVAPGNNWEGSNGGTGAVSNILLWDVDDLNGKNFKFEDVTATGYWTKGGKQVVVAVPEPATWAMLLLGFFGLGVVLRKRRTQRLSAA